MIGIIDYGVSNLKSVENALNFLGAKSTIIDSKEVLENKIDELDKLILPGVGAFGDGMRMLKEKSLDVAIKTYIDTGKPLLGICLGMQFLFEESEEKGINKGLGILKGRVTHIPKGDKIPHMGWNSLNFTNNNDNSIFKNIDEKSYVYFVHSYYAVTNEEYITSTTNYNAKLTASVQKGNVYATQFHPEKSGEVGLNIMENFINL